MPSRCPNCGAPLPDRGLSMCLNCGAAYHLHHATAEPLSGAWDAERSRALVDGLLAARWEAHLQRSV